MTLKKLFTIFAWWNLIIIKLPLNAVKLNALGYILKEEEKKQN